MRTASARHTRPAAAGVALAALLVAGCSDDEAAPAPTPTPTPPTATERLEQARGVLVDAGSVHLALAGTELPEDQGTYVISAVGDGTMEPPAFTGTITAKLAGIQADIPAVALDGALWVKLPFTPSHVQTDPADLGVPDPATLFDPEAGLVGLLPQTVDPQFGEKVRAGAEVVQEVVGTLPGQAVADLLHLGDGASEFDVTYGLVEESWQVRTVTITGEFYPPATSTYTVTLDRYGAPVTVTEP